MTPKRLQVGHTCCYGPWLSCGLHVDLSGPFVDIHILWWMVRIGFYNYKISCGRCSRRNNEILN